MGYRIRYEDGLKKENISLCGEQNYAVRIVMFLTTVCIATFALFGESEKVQDILVPGNAEVTRSAMHSFMEDIREGDRLKDAVSAFCSEIIENAEIPE